MPFLSNLSVLAIVLTVLALVVLATGFNRRTLTLSAFIGVLWLIVLARITSLLIGTDTVTLTLTLPYWSFPVGATLVALLVFVYLFRARFLIALGVGFVIASLLLLLWIL